MGGFIHLRLIVAVVVLVIQHFRDDTEAEYPQGDRIILTVLASL